MREMQRRLVAVPFRFPALAARRKFGSDQGEPIMSQFAKDGLVEVEWNRLTAAELRARAQADAIVLLPVASTEQHGPHLATGVDMFLGMEGCRRIAEKVSKQRPCVVAPSVWMGLAEHHVAFGGTFTLSLPTWHALLRDLCRSILRAGFKKILLVNSHGGNMSALNALTVDLTKELDAPIATTTLYSVAHEAGAFASILEDQTQVMHACEAETSMMMAVKADCVRADKVAEAVGPALTAAAALSRALHTWRAFDELSGTGVIGDARKSTAAKGEQLFEIATTLIADKLIAGEPWN
jgi:creatinine amidohydrolase